MMSSHTVSQSTYTNRAKSLTISKHKRKFNYSSQKVAKVRSGISVILNAFCKIFLCFKMLFKEFLNRIIQKLHRNLKKIYFF